MWCGENDIEADESKWGWFWRNINDIMPRMKEKGRSKGHGEGRVFKGIALKEQSSASGL